MQNTSPLQIGICGVAIIGEKLNGKEVRGGFEPPYLVLQTSD